ncbi:hypothetical protein, partial [Salmonella sp. s29873]|uniref:hypothetical protein n=1 Tax=Salmonella sp. s29873 TaxID=3159634 RepID=UPI003981216B
RTSSSSPWTQPGGCFIYTPATTFNRALIEIYTESLSSNLRATQREQQQTASFSWQQTRHAV